MSMVNRNKDVDRIFSEDRVLIEFHQHDFDGHSRPGFSLGMRASYMACYILSNITPKDQQGSKLIFRLMKNRFDFYDTGFFKEVAGICPSVSLTDDGFIIADPKDVVMFKLKYSEYL